MTLRPKSAIVLALLVSACATSPARRPSAAETQIDPIAEVKTSFIDLARDWKFQPDPNNAGLAQNWMGATFYDGDWRTLEAGRAWSEQGVPANLAVGWYRTSFFVPESWKGSKIRLTTDGIGDAYEIYVQGKYVKGFGGVGYSYAQWEMDTDLSGALEFGKENVIAIRVSVFPKSQGGDGNPGIWRRLYVKRTPPFEGIRAKLPEPVLPDHPEWTRLYWKAWELAWEKLILATPKSGFVPVFMDEGFNEQIYQWDSSFISQFGQYGPGVFPAMETLDNFYRKQRSDGYIQRSYSETTGEEAEKRTPKEPAVNPPLFAWAELQYAKRSGDGSRLARVFPQLEAYFGWLKRNARTAAGKGLYFETMVGCGMDNLPRGDSEGAGWVDISMQQALAARSLSEIAGRIGLKDREKAWKKEYAELRELINRLLWDEKRGFYFELQRNGTRSPVMHIGALWALIAGVASDKQAARMVEHLENPDEFNRPNLFPSLSHSDPAYRPEGGYWLGGVWAPTNFITIRGLQQYGYGALARKATFNYLKLLSDVFELRMPDKIKGELSSAGRLMPTLWENYSPEVTAPGKFEKTYSHEDFVGWTGIGPIVLFLEDVIGIKLQAEDNRVIWDLNETGEVGARGLRFGTDNLLSLVAEPAHEGAERAIAVSAEKPFHLEIRSGKRSWKFDVAAGDSTLKLSKRRTLLQKLREYMSRPSR